MRAVPTFLHSTWFFGKTQDIVFEDVLMRRKKEAKRTPGFALVELLVAIAIMEVFLWRTRV